MAETNPNGANQYQLDPRQKVCWDLYVDPSSPTFSNGMQSAIKAGYEEAYANQITTTEWFKEKVRRSNMLNKAERNLDKALDIPIEDEKLGDRCLKATIFVAERLGKQEYSTRQELTGADGKDLIPDQERKELASGLIKEYLDDNTGTTTR